MLKKKLGIEAIEREGLWINSFFKISSTLIIPEGVKEIGLYTFSNCEKLEKVLIPESVKYIRYGSFLDCKKLREVRIPESVKGIGNIAFAGCWDAKIILKNPKSEFEYIGEDAFLNCKSVTYAEEETRN